MASVKPLKRWNSQNVGPHMSTKYVPVPLCTDLISSLNTARKWGKHHAAILISSSHCFCEVTALFFFVQFMCYSNMYFILKGISSFYNRSRTMVTTRHSVTNIRRAPLFFSQCNGYYASRYLFFELWIFFLNFLTHFLSLNSNKEVIKVFQKLVIFRLDC